MGRRDYAILLLLARMGLRSSEVALLELDDMDWKAARFSVRGKLQRSAKMTHLRSFEVTQAEGRI